MCGIVGIFSQSGDLFPIDVMTSALSHRGPDAGAVWLDTDGGVALGHRRLSIVDLSEAGAQPMHSPSGRFVLVFNGEIYNHLKLRQLLGYTLWRGHSDTETLLAAIEAWGLEKALSHSVGMFAFALWDTRKRRLFLARDRMGEKPLYYGWQRGAFLFALELKALRCHPAFSADVDRGALALYMRHNAVPAPHSIYTGIRKLPPGTFESGCGTFSMTCEVTTLVMSAPTRSTAATSVPVRTSSVMSPWGSAGTSTMPLSHSYETRIFPAFRQRAGRPLVCRDDGARTALRSACHLS